MNYVDIGNGAPEWPKVALAAIGRVGTSLSFTTVYLYSGELFPTVVRNVGVGSASMNARIGSMIAPFITSIVSIDCVINSDFTITDVYHSFSV